MSVADAVLLKPGPLTGEEREKIKLHVIEGERFAAALDFVPAAALALIRHHHERWDGHGYPGGLSGTDIPLLARLFAVIDSYDALISPRPYKAAWPQPQAREELERLAGQMYDPQMVTALLALLASDAALEDAGRLAGSQALPLAEGE